MKLSIAKSIKYSSFTIHLSIRAFVLQSIQYSIVFCNATANRYRSLRAPFKIILRTKFKMTKFSKWRVKTKLKKPDATDSWKQLAGVAL